MTLNVRRDPLLDTDVQIADRDVDFSVAQLHQALFSSGLEASLLEAIEAIPGEKRGEKRAILHENGIDALDGLYCDIVVTAASATEWAQEDPNDGQRIDRAESARQELVEVTRQLGTGSSLGLRTSKEDISGGPIALLQVSEVTPTVELTLTAEFASRRPEQRREVLNFLEHLATACDVTIVATGLAQRCIDEKHADQVAGHLTSTCNPHRGQDTPAAAQEALGSLTRGGTGTQMLKGLSVTPSGALSYDDLRRELRLEAADGSLVPQTAKRLEEQHELAERIERPDGSVALSLLPAGEAVVQELETDEEIRRKASTSWTSSESDDRPPKILPPCRVNPPARDGGEETGATADADSTAADAVDRPAGEAAVATQETGYAEGWVGVAYMDRPRHVAAAGAAESGEIGLVDSTIVRDEDGRRPYWSYDERRDEMVVGAEYHNPMQVWVTLARSLASENTFERVLTADRLGENLEGLEASDRELLQDARCVGWLSGDATGEDLVDELRMAREDLLDLTSDLKTENYEDRNEHRGEILRLALGLAGTIVHLLDLLDVEVVREVQVPEYSRHFTREDRRADLARTIATGAAIQSRYGHFSAFRQLFEPREKKRSEAWNPRVRPGDSVGSLIGSFVLVGNGLANLEDELAAHLEGPRELHEDAPEFGVRIPIGTATRQATARAVQQLLSWKGMRPSREAVDVLHGFASDPYAVCEGLNRALEHESKSRGIHLDEVRRALSVLDEDRLLPEAAPAARKGVAALLEADRPISQAELARRAGISTQSWRNHREALVEAGIIQKSSGGWRVCLPFSSERGRDIEAFLPWFLVENPQINGMKRSTRHPTDVLMELVFQFGAEATGAIEEFAYSGKWPPEPEDVDGTIEALEVGPIWELICAGCGDGSDIPPTEVTMGAEQYIQTALPTA
ncbi:hypothetical protein CP556_25035 [Natrinema sp. CBA1119]|uniref:winged helix-turn-helix domain-containing protein n=1 Tax=Natrinema sp. CBA1119 TaxID=1608465 RepID=UPI000BF26746|nr:winged helix-turn-helix domain-containing protein [Natrinema sp. CBA1119]PGF13796.1 hypothetical protein CP556_25035 [Natrinema sp. CBA1119]